MIALFLTIGFGVCFIGALIVTTWPRSEPLPPFFYETDMLQEQICRECGCHEFNACYGPETGSCWWVEFDLCSCCAGLQPDATGPVNSRKLVGTARRRQAQH